MVVVTANSFEDSKITVNYDTGWDAAINCYRKGRECIAVDLEIAKSLRGMKYHFKSAEHVR